MKRIVSIVLVVAIVFSLIGCSTTSTINRKPVSANVYDSTGNIIGHVEVPAGNDTLEWTDWAQFVGILEIVSISFSFLTGLFSIAAAT